MRRAKVYNKYLVKRSVSGKDAAKDDKGNPILSDLLKSNIVITPEQAEVLNFGWDSREKPVSFYYKEVEEEKNEKASDKEERKELFAEAKELGIEDVAKNIKTSALKERIANHKAE